MDGGDGALPDQPLQSEVDVRCSDGIFTKAAVPSGASTGGSFCLNNPSYVGVYEALELRDGGSDYLGKGVSKGLKDKHSENVCKDGMEDAVSDKDAEDPFESQGDVGVGKGDGAELNADLSDSEVSESLLCDGVINMLRKILDTKQTREIVRNETLKRQRNNESQDNCAPPKAYSRCSVPYFLEVVKATCKSQKKVELVRSIGFPYLLELDDSVVPRSFAQWVADKVRVEDELIIIHDKKIPLNAESVFHVFGIPAGETIINTTDDGGKEDFLALFGLSEVPTIKYFGNKIIKEEELSDDQYIRCFMVVALATFLCPTSNTKPSTKYMGALLDVSKIKEVNWCKFTHTWLIQAINKYQKEKMKPNKTTLTLGGCIYYLVVRCLDFIDFGPIQLQSTMPRICVWKGNLIKLFSEALLDKNGAYRACKIKNESETCYGLENHGWASTERHSYLKAAIEKAVGDAVNEKAKEDIYLSFQHYMKDEGPNTCSKVKQLILQVLQIVTIAACASEKTVRIESSSNQQNSTNVKHDSEATVKVNSNGEYIEEHEDIISRKKRRIGDEIGRSTNEAPETSLVKVRTLSQQSCGSVGTHSKAEQNLAGDEEKTNFQSCAFEFEQRITKEELQVAVGSLKLGEQETRTNVGVEIKQEDSHQDKFIHLKAGSTTSFDYMLCAQKFESTASHQQQQGLSTNSTTFVGFGENTTPQKEEPGNDQVPERMSIDINKVFVPDEDPGLTQTGQTAWARYLDESRKKYFFYDDDTPTLRLFENHDDCGNEIEEPELWRPLHMMSDAYERKIESAKRNGPASRTEGGDNFFSKEAKQSCKSTNQFQHQSSSTVKGFSVCCAQDQQSNRFICTPRPLTAITKDGTIIDLTSPKANDIFRWNQQQTCYTPGNKNNSHFSGGTSHKTGATSHKTNMGSPSHTIVGRRLFHDDESHVHILDGTKQNPITFRDSQPASPEVQFLGERSLQEKCLNMLGNSDEHYNTRLFLGSTNSSVGKENIPPKRIVQPSRFRCSPYDDQDRGSLMSHEVELYSNIMILSRDPDFKGKWVVEIDNCRVSMEQLGNSFRDKGWVESYVINVFCRKLFRDNHPRVSQRHFFFHTASEYFLQKWKNEQARLMWKDKLIKSFIGAGKAKDLQLCNELFFPTLHENHWFVFLVDLCARKFIFLDSKYDEDSPYHRSIKHMLIENFKQAWNDAGLRNMGFRHYETAYPNLPKQDGCDACGIFVLKWLENWRSRNVLQKVFKQDNVKDARIRLAVDILFSKHNILEEGKRLVKNL